MTGLGGAANARRLAVLTYVVVHPGCSARDVARDVFGGTGGTRTPERGLAGRDLVALESRGAVRREKPDDYAAGLGDRWYETEREIE